MKLEKNCLKLLKVSNLIDYILTTVPDQNMTENKPDWSEIIIALGTTMFIFVDFGAVHIVSKQFFCLVLPPPCNVHI